MRVTSILVGLGMSTAVCAPLLLVAPSATAQPLPGRAAKPAPVVDESSIAVTPPTTVGRDTPARAPAAAGRASSDPAQTTTEQRVLAYWTPQRLAAAVPRTPARPSASVRPGASAAVTAGALAATRGAGGSGSTAPVAPRAAASSAAKVPGASTAAGPKKTAGRISRFSMTNGKLFFDGYGKDHGYCTAAAINTPTKRVVVTAGHCVYEAGQWSRNLVFVPGYDGRKKDPHPRGMFAVKKVRTFNSWVRNQDYTRDVAFATLANGGDRNRRVVDEVGGHGLSWGGSRSFAATIFGYPSNRTKPDGAFTMWACGGKTFPADTMTKVVGCYFGPGSSGGPWLYRYNSKTGLGRVRSVTSLWDGSGGGNWGPYFDAAVKKMLDKTAKDW